MRRAVALTQGAGHISETELVCHCLEDALVALGRGVSGLYVSLRTEAEAHLGILLITNADIDVGHQVAHDGLCLSRRPEFLAVVKVAAYGNAGTTCGLERHTQTLGSLRADGGSDAAPMEPVGIAEDGVEVKVLGLCLADTAVGTVVDNLAGTHAGSRLEIVDAHARSAADDEVGVDTIPLQCIYSGLAHLVGGQLRHKIGLMTIIGQADGHIGLASAIGGIETVCLDNTRIVVSREAKHYFAHRDDLCHIERCH